MARLWRIPADQRAIAHSRMAIPTVCRTTTSPATRCAAAGVSPRRRWRVLSTCTLPITSMSIAIAPPVSMPAVVPTVAPEAAKAISGIGAVPVGVGRGVGVGKRVSIRRRGGVDVIRRICRESVGVTGGRILDAACQCGKQSDGPDRNKRPHNELPGGRSVRLQKCGLSRLALRRARQSCISSRTSPMNITRSMMTTVPSKATCHVGASNTDYLQRTSNKWVPV
jgi:hypothetical protein